MIAAVDLALKYRLTGGVILLIVAVLLLPELLTGSGEAQRAPAPAPVLDDATERRLEIDLRHDAVNLLRPRATAPEPPETMDAPSVPPAPPAAVASPPAAAAAAPDPPPSPGRRDATPHYVQIGVFVNRASATRLAGKLKAGKFAVQVEEIRRDDRLLHRVRVGPTADRAAARAMLQRLKAAGFNGSVVK